MVKKFHPSEVLMMDAEVKVYKRRWVMLGLFSLCNMCNLFHWIQYSVINNIICEYYNVSAYAVDWLSMIYMVMYILLVMPASYFLNQKGLRWTVTVGILGTAVGGWIKVFSVSPDRFYLTMIGQTVVATAQSFLFGISARLAACWFGPDQVSTASAIGFLFGEVGVALGFVIPPIMVDAHPLQEQVEKDLRLMFYCGSLIPTVLLVFVLICFRRAPPRPPSIAAATANEIASATDTASFKTSLKNIISSKNYIFLLLAFSISNSVLDSLNTLLNSFILSHFPTKEEYAGELGLLSILTGLVGSFLFGLLLDKTHKFRATSIFLYVLQIASFVAFGVFLQMENILLVYVMMGLLGVGSYSFYTVSYEYAAELTYPESEGISSGILNAVMYFMGIVLTVVSRSILHLFGDFWANVFYVSWLCVGFIFCLLIQGDLKRQYAQNGFYTS